MPKMSQGSEYQHSETPMPSMATATKIVRPTAAAIVIICTTNMVSKRMKTRLVVSASSARDIRKKAAEMTMIAQIENVILSITPVSSE